MIYIHTNYRIVLQITNYTDILVKCMGRGASWFRFSDALKDKDISSCAYSSDGGAVTLNPKPHQPPQQADNRAPGSHKGS